MTLIAVFLVLVFLVSLLSDWLRRTVVTEPIVFTAAGALSFLGLRRSASSTQPTRSRRRPSA